jgi:glycosyltransferase involved in cell wall biosynthesis
MVLKICVYSIALNEELHVERWYNSIKDHADYIVVGDTGSTDNTIQKFRQCEKVELYNISVKPWRFDTARNSVLALIPNDADICISLDLDEWLDTGWREKIESVWVPGTTTRISYRFAWDYGNRPDNWFWVDKMHSRHGYLWKRPVHECIFPTQDTEEVHAVSEVQINQIQDYTKGTRSQYLDLLKLSHEENPMDSQILHWYARELRWQNNTECVPLFKKYLELPSSTWHLERADAMRHISAFENTEKWLSKAVIEAPDYRTAWVELARYYYTNAKWMDCLWASQSGLTKSQKSGTYLDDQNSWGPDLDDYAAIAYWNLGHKNQALYHSKQALALSPNDTRLQNNMTLIENSM